MKKLNEDEELEFLLELHGRPEYVEVFEQIRHGLEVLQIRSQMLLGLITICLTVTGFSGHMIARSSQAARLCVFGGVLSVLVSAIVLMYGPLRVNWITGSRESDIKQTVVALIKRRNERTRIYHVAAVFLVLGLTGYVLSLGFFLLSVD
ncbi:MAG: hypothetical protein OSB41_02605 [Kiritimatiellae bacterium]|nr:hypothetical protein [Kiritimatiellia bacterium]